MFEISTKHLKRCTIIQLKGRLDHTTLHMLEAAMARLDTEKKYRIVIDAEGLNYVSRVGLRALLLLHKTCRRYNRGRVYLAHLQPYVRDTLELVGFRRIFTFFDEVYQAVGSF